MRIAIIPARGGSRRIARKNIRVFHGRPIIAYSIEAAKESGLFDLVAVSTEDAEIGQVAERYGADVMWRPLNLAVDEVGTQEVAASALRNVPGVSTACVIYATAPLLRAEDLRAAYTQLIVSMKHYVYVPGVYYFGFAYAFTNGMPLEEHGKRLTLPDGRDIDINTPSDWEEAEARYVRLEGT